MVNAYCAISTSVYVSDAGVINESVNVSNRFPDNFAFICKKKQQ